MDEATKTRFMCSVNNEAVLKVLFKIKDAELTFAKAISVAVETEDAAKVAKETVYGSDRSNAVFPILQDLKSDVALQEACQRVCQDFPDLFKPELRCLKDRQLEIQFKPDSKPLFCKPRVVPCHKLAHFRIESCVRSCAASSKGQYIVRPTNVPELSQVPQP
ncbi:hypothetical protein EMCRGX_G030193 [Ephydatia muelleri]